MTAPKRPADLPQLTDAERDALEIGYIAMAGVEAGEEPVERTAGEWQVFDNRGDPDFAGSTTAGLIGVTVAGRYGSDIAHCFGFDSGRSVEEVMANARLIAASPLMLAKLQEIAGECCQCDGRAELDGEPCEICQDIHDVIALAYRRRMTDAELAAARVRAASPGLLKALKAVVSVADRKTDEFDLAHAAIAKAEGRQP